VLSEYARHSRALDSEVLRTIDAWHASGRPLADREFDDLALRIFAYQLRYNEPYSRYCASLGVSETALPNSWQAIPAVPSDAFKETTLATFDPAHAALAFETSGTTSGTGGRHYMETRTLYDAALLAGFDRFMLADGARPRFLNLVPNPAERPESSLGYMMAQVSAQRGDGQTGWYLRGEDLLFEAFLSDVGAAVTDGAAVCIATTAFALVHVLDEMAQRRITFALPPGSRIMETGGFKGRARIVDRAGLYARACEGFGIAESAIVAEYGMTELSSQYYDEIRSATGVDARRKAAPPTLRTRVVAPNGATLPNGTVGALLHVDLANRSSCVAILTEDLGVAFEDGLVLIGREAGATLRGCSLDAETLRPR
jgi:Acyl-protein synthetase, LuxE